MALAKPLTKADQSATRSPRAVQQSAAEHITLGDAVDAWFVHLRAGNVSPKTLAAYGWGVGRFTQHLDAGYPLSSITVEDVESFIGSLKTSGLSEASRNAAYRPVR